MIPKKMRESSSVAVLETRRLDRRLTDGNAELVTGNEGTTDLARADFGHVEDDDGRDESYSESSEKTTDDDGGQGRGSEHLNDDTGEVLQTKLERISKMYSAGVRAGGKNSRYRNQR
jgi:hypothetical protein